MHYQISSDIIVVGAGITGLSLAYFLARSKKKVVVIEKGDRVGGVIHSERVDGFLIEHGPNSILETHPAIMELLDGLNLKAFVEYANENSKKRYIVKNGHLCPLPLGLIAFLCSPLFSAKAKLRCGLEPWISKGDPSVDESVAEFVERRLGLEFLNYAVDPFVAGVYAGMPEQLSLKSAFPKLHTLEQEYGSLIKGSLLGATQRKKRKETARSVARMFSFPDGLSTLIDSLKQNLKENIHCSTSIQAVRKTFNGYEVVFEKGKDLWRVQSKVVIFTVPAYCYQSIPIEFDFSIREALNKIYYPPIAVVYFAYQNNPSKVPVDGFGFLVPQKENKSILGTLWNSAIFSSRAPAGGTLFTTFVGGSRQPENALLSDNKLLAVVQNELRSLMGIEQPPDLSIIHRVPKSIPQYWIGHEKIVQSLVSFETRNPGLYLRGNFIWGISLGDIIREAEHTTQLIEEYL